MRSILAGAALLWLAGCGLVEPARLDPPPGHRVVLGRVDMAALDVNEVTVEILKDDRSFHLELRVGPGPEDFALALPAGGYRMVSVRAVKDRRAAPNYSVSEVGLAFQAGPEPAAYIGTLRLAADFGERIHVTVADDYERTVATLRARYADLPAEVARRLLTPA